MKWGIYTLAGEKKTAGGQARAGGKKHERPRRVAKRPRRVAKSASEESPQHKEGGGAGEAVGLRRAGWKGGGKKTTNLRPSLLRFL